MVIQDLIWLIRDNGVPILDSPAGSPSKVLAASLGSFSLSGTTQSDDNAKETVVPHRIEKKRAMPKKADNFVTDELQLLVDPGPAAALAQKHLRHPDPNIGKLEARKESEAAIIKAMHGPDHPGAVPAPPRNSHYDSPSEVQKMWIQESLLRMALPAMVQTWEAREQAKLELKANKGKKVAGKRSPSGKKASETESKAGTPTKAPKPQKKPSKTKAKAIIDTESEPEDFFGPTRQASQDVFNAPTLPKAVVRSSRDDEGRIELKARIPAAKYKRPKDRESTSSLSSSDSDIQLISVSQLPARKSPRKSPRKTQSQKTARSVADPNALQEKDQTVSGLAVLSFDVIKKGNSQALNSLTDKEKLQQRTQKLSVQPKKPYSYQDVSDSDNDSIQEPLPSLTRLLKTKDTNTIERNAESTRSGSIPLSQSSSSSSSHKPSESRNMASKTNSIALKSSRRVTSTKGGAAACHTISQIIDLCSSD